LGVTDGVAVGGGEVGGVKRADGKFEAGFGNWGKGRTEAVGGAAAGGGELGMGAMGEALGLEVGLAFRLGSVLIFTSGNSSSLARLGLFTPSNSFSRLAVVTVEFSTVVGVSVSKKLSPRLVRKI
jgi:hypothetical protein